jgi:hypothetical protein
MLKWNLELHCENLADPKPELEPENYVDALNYLPRISLRFFEYKLRLDDLADSHFDYLNSDPFR